eukprot:Awhi_evm1s13255
MCVVKPESKQFEALCTSIGKSKQSCQALAAFCQWKGEPTAPTTPNETKTGCTAKLNQEAYAFYCDTYGQTKEGCNTYSSFCEWNVEDSTNVESIVDAEDLEVTGCRVKSGKEPWGSLCDKTSDDRSTCEGQNGYYCEWIESDSGNDEVAIASCINDGCLNGGSCDSLTGTCSCIDGHSGASCEIPSPNSRSGWMSGKHGISYFIPAGVHLATALYNASALAAQIKDLPISWLIVGLSGGAYGDQYLAPHSILTNLNRGSTPKHIPAGDVAGWYYILLFSFHISYLSILSSYYNFREDFDIESFEDRDIFDEIITAMDSINVKVIAYMASQGPHFGKHGATRAYDYNNKSSYVNSCVLCPELTGVPGCDCSPGVLKWKKYVKDTYGSDDEAMLRKAYAEKIVGEYAQRYGDRIAGFWFDSGIAGDGPQIRDAIRPHNPNAAIAFNHGSKIPLRNNNPGVEDYTYGHMTPTIGAKAGGFNPTSGCYNYGMVLSAESSINGFVYPTVTPDVNYPAMFDPETRPNSFNYTYSSPAEASLAHVYMPFTEKWASGNIVWNVNQAREWQARVLKAKGAWTWSLPRSGCAYCMDVESQSIIDPDDFAFLKEIYKGLPGGSEEVKEPYNYNSNNCDCTTHLTTIPSYQWGCTQ